MNQEFQLPDGSIVGTGNLQASEEAMAKASSDYRVFGENYYLDKSDIEKLLKGDRYKELRAQRAYRKINQARMNKCNASATINAIHHARERAGLPTKVLSDCHLYMRINDGQDQGCTLTDGFNELKRNGVAPRALEWAGKQYTIPSTVYNKSQIPREWLDVANRVGQEYKSFEAFTLPTDYATFKIAVASALARDYPIVFAWDVTNAGMRLSNGYVNNGRGIGNHANVASSAKWVGGDDLVHPDDDNSWGPSVDPLYGPTGTGWGDNGFGLFTMQSFFQCRRWHMFWVLVSTTQEPSVDPLS